MIGDTATKVLISDALNTLNRRLHLMSHGRMTNPTIESFNWINPSLNNSTVPLEDDRGLFSYYTCLKHGLRDALYDDVIPACYTPYFAHAPDSIRKLVQ